MATKKQILRKLETRWKRKQAKAERKAAKAKKIADKKREKAKVDAAIKALRKKLNG